MLIVEVDAIGPKALQRALDHLLDVLRPAVEPCWSFKVEPEFRGDRDLVADRRERLSDKIFVGVGAVDLGRIEERDALFVGGADDVEAWPPIDF